MHAIIETTKLLGGYQTTHTHTLALTRHELSDGSENWWGGGRGVSNYDPLYTIQALAGLNLREETCAWTYHVV